MMEPVGGSGKKIQSTDSFFSVDVTPDVQTRTSLDPRIAADSSGFQISFKVGDAHIDGGGLRPITYFPLITTVCSIAAGATAVRHTTSRLWLTGTPIRANRRYSEFCALRTFLMFQHPSIIVPPLPPKSYAEGMMTYLARADVLLFQQRAVARFLSEVSCAQQLMDDPAVQKFCQLPRDQFSSFLDDIVKRNSRRGVNAGLIPSTGAFASGFVRGIAHSVAAWWSGNADARSVGLGETDKREQLLRALNNMPQYMHWSSRMAELRRLKQTLAEATQAYGVLHNSHQGILDDVAAFCVALEDFSGSLRCAAAFEDSSGDVLRCATFADGVKKQHELEILKDQSQIHEALRHEEHWISAACEASSNMMDLLQEHVQRSHLGAAPRPEDTMDLQYEASVAQCNAVSDQLAHTMDSFLADHRKRIQKVIETKVQHAVHFLAKEQQYTETHPLVVRRLELPAALNNCETPIGGQLATAVAFFEGH